MPVAKLYPAKHPVQQLERKYKWNLHMKTKLKHSYFIGLIVLLLVVFIITGILLQLRLESILTGIGQRERSVLTISRLLTSGSILAIFLLSYIIIRRLRRQQSLILQLEHLIFFRGKETLVKMAMLNLRYEKYSNGTAINYFFNSFLIALLPVQHGRMRVCKLLDRIEQVG